MRRTPFHGRTLSCRAAIVLALATTAAQAQQGGPVTHEATESAQAVMEYWTPERMAAAIPLDVPGVVDKGLPRPAAPLPGDARPGFAPGWDPKSGLEPPDPLTRYELDDEQWASFAAYLEGQARANGPAAFGSPPANPVDYPGYGKFARWTWYGNYLTFPTSTIGKLFFTKPGVGNFVCSATVIGRSTLATAGHCVASIIGGTPTWHTNLQFCPSYYKGSGSGAPHPNRGCWSAVAYATTNQWFYHENFDRDYACIVTATTGTVHANKVGNVTGWIGRGYNLSLIHI
jgi:hypothetical protein